MIIASNHSRQGALLLAVLLGAVAWLAFLYSDPVAQPSTVQAPEGTQPFSAESGDSSPTLPDSPEVWAPRLRTDAAVPPEAGLDGLSRLPWEPVGELPHDLLRFMLEGLSVLRNQSLEAKHRLLSDSPTALHSLELADLDIDIEGADAKANALLSGSYLLVPKGHTLPQAIHHNPNLHVVIAPGGEKGGTAFTTYLLIDLRKQGRFAEALRVRGMRKQEIENRLLSRFLQYSQTDRERVIRDDEGPRELVEIWAEMRRRGVKPTESSAGR